MAVFTPRPWKYYDGSSRCGHGFCAGACRVQADTGRSRARLCGLQACQQRQVIGNYRRPDVSLEVLEAAPGGTSQAVGALETRDAGLDAGAEVSQPAVHPAALDHVFDRQAALLVEGHVGEAASRTRSPITSRSNWAKDNRMLRVSRPIEVVVLNCWVTATKLTPWRSNSSTILAKSISERVSRSTL